METTRPSRRAATSTWFSTTTGPEATNPLSSGAAGVGAVRCGTGGGAAATLELSLALLQLHRASAMIISGASARTRFIGPPGHLLPCAVATRRAGCPPNPRRACPERSRGTPALPSSPSKPGPQLGPDPYCRPPEQHLSGWTPARYNFASTLHAITNRAIRIGDRDPGEEGAVRSLYLAPGADHSDLAVKSAGRKSFQLYGGFLAGMKQQDIVFVDGHIHDGARSIYDFGKGVAGRQLPAHQIFHVRSCDHAIYG